MTESVDYELAQLLTKKEYKSQERLGKYKEFFIESNKPVDEVRELYFQACEKLGFGLDSQHKSAPCKNYQESHFKPETIQKLVDFGLNISEDDEERWTKDYVNFSEFCDLILEFIKTQDKELIMIRVTNEVPMFQFYGFDEQNRHIGSIGYGLFD